MPDPEPIKGNEKTLTDLMDFVSDLLQGTKGTEESWSLLFICFDTAHLIIGFGGGL